MNHPIQGIQWCQPTNLKEHGVLLASCGSNLFSVSLKDGSQISSWSSEPQALVTDEPPLKKRKTDQEGLSPSPNIAILRVTSNDEHAVVVTGEDKCVHVLSISADGRLDHLSRRCMPKRPSALAITDHEDRILIADKFGDVYSIPLLLDPEQEAIFLAESEAKDEAKPYKPAATALTVHSQRNLKALEQQQKRKEEPAKTKQPLRFSHQLILGHVSMLTDLLYVRVPRGEKHRDYIITADRDEHIRVSRGQPQAHIIESYCLGHKSFVSRLCMVSPEVLVSGDGDGHLHVWNWIKGQSIKKVDVGQLLSSKNLDDEHSGDSHGRSPISGLWTYPHGSKARQLLVACEGHDKLFYITIETLLGPEAIVPIGTYDLSANVLDLAICGNNIMVSLDNVHAPQTTNEDREQEKEQPDEAAKTTGLLTPTAKNDRLCMLEYDQACDKFSQLRPDEKTHELLDRMEGAIDTRIDGKWSGELLYGLSSLRKHGGDNPGEELQLGSFNQVG